eukprot:6191360-Pleurochrysis_carterae.AAC.3
MQALAWIFTHLYPVATSLRLIRDGMKLQARQHQGRSQKESKHALKVADLANMSCVLVGYGIPARSTLTSMQSQWQAVPQATL